MKDNIVNFVEAKLNAMIEAINDESANDALICPCGSDTYTVLLRDEVHLTCTKCGMGLDIGSE